MKGRYTMKKLLISSLFFITMLAPSTVKGAAPCPPVSAMSDSISTYSADEDVIVYKFRTYNGRTQYHRWNETKQKWVDPYWINF